MIVSAAGSEYKPQHMCYKCISKLLKFASFIDLSHKNDLKFDSLYQSCLEAARNDKFGKRGNCLLKSHKSANGILESRGAENLVPRKSQISQRRQLSPSLNRNHKSFSLVKSPNIESINKFQCFFKKYSSKTTVKPRVKQQESCSVKGTKNAVHKKKNEFTKCLNLGKKYLKINPGSKSQMIKSSRISKK